MACVGSGAGNRAVLERAIMTDDGEVPEVTMWRVRRLGSAWTVGDSAHRGRCPGAAEGLWVSNGGPSVRSDESYKGRGPQITKRKKSLCPSLGHKGTLVTVGYL